jgi:Fur family ferric uptake transcriptional regulator
MKNDFQLTNAIDVETNEMARALRQAGYKLTQPRLAVLYVLQEADEYLSPLDIHQRGQETYARLGLVTVYRTLEILDELGVARRVHAGAHCHGFARAAGDKHYLVCRACGHVSEFPCEGLDPLVESVQHKTGYLVEEHLLELVGLCPDCQARKG